jgi:hypothetical protein
MHGRLAAPLLLHGKHGTRRPYVRHTNPQTSSEDTIDQSLILNKSTNQCPVEVHLESLKTLETFTEYAILLGASVVNKHLVSYTEFLTL